MSVAQSPQQRPPAPGAGARKVLLIVGASMVFIVLNATGVNVALPAIGGDLGVEPGLLGWIMTAYLLVYGVAIPLFGRIAADRQAGGPAGRGDC
jgi:predicted MFS family arabinose efflux permease